MVNKAATRPLNTLSKTGHSINILDVGEVMLGPRGALSFVAFADSPLQQMSKLKALSRCRCANHTGKGPRQQLASYIYGD